MQETLHPPRTATQHRVLLVDDDAVSLEILALMLGYDGHQVLRACDATAALSMLSRGDCGVFPDVLLVDMHMPGISAQLLAEQVRALEAPQPLLLAMSASAMNSRQLRGFDGFLQKPLAIEDLRCALQTKSRAAGPAGTRTVRSKNGGAPKQNGKPSADHSNGHGAQTAILQDERSVDETVLAKLAKAMPAAALKELYEACIVDSRARASTLKKLAQTRKPAEIPREAHRIKGSALMIGASRLARLAAALEQGSCKEEDTVRLVDDLEHAVDELERILAGRQVIEIK